MRFSAGFVSLLGAIVLSLSACAPKRTVQIPNEWRKARPAPQTAVPKAAHPKPLQTPPTEASAPVAILKPPPSISEKDLSTAPEAASPPSPKKPREAPPPQQTASMHLVDQAKTALAQGKPDPAITMLEQAVQVDVYNGEAFLQLAKAWRMKGFPKKSLEFSRKAEVLFHEDKSRLKDVYLFQADLYKDMGDTKGATQCRQKASKL